MKQNIKLYPKEYEDVFSGERALVRLKPEKFKNDLGYSYLQYLEIYRRLGRELFLTFFDNMVKFYWLNTHLKCGQSGYRTSKKGKMFWLRPLFFLYAINCIGMDFRSITVTMIAKKIGNYLNEFFPMFYENNPFDDPEYYKFPFKHITLDFLLLVYQMPERMDLLNVAESKKMTYAQFADYVINYIMCYNNDHKQQVYTFIASSKQNAYYVRYNLGDKNSQFNAKRNIGIN